MSVGAKLTKVPQGLPGASPAPPIGQFVVSTKSPGFVPVTAMFNINNAAVPVLETLMTIGVLIVLTI